jgi:cardiolipin synthase (CMP-forming)
MIRTIFPIRSSLLHLNRSANNLQHRFTLRLFSAKRDEIFNIPNTLTLSRIALTPVIGFCITQQSLGLGIGLLGIAALTDFLDGWIARKYNMKTALGSLLDPAADKFLMTTLTISLTHAGSIPLPLACIIIGRDVFLIGQTLYFRYHTLTLPV